MYNELSKKQAKEICLQATQNKGNFVKGFGEYDYVSYRTVFNGTTYEVQHATNDSINIYEVRNHGDEDELENVYSGNMLSDILGKRTENPDKNTIYFQPI